jgi:hypothetical protein
VSPFLTQDRHEPADCGAVFASFRGIRQPAALGEAGLMPARRARDLVVGGCGDGGGGAGPAAVLRRRTASLTRVGEIEIP